MPGIEPDGRLIWTHYDALRPAAVPASMIIVGTGAIGIEFATIYAAMGTKITLIERELRILPLEDAEIAGLMDKALHKAGIVRYVCFSLAKVTKGADHVSAHLPDGTILTADRLQSAAGVVVNIDGLAAFGVAMSAGSVLVDDVGKTNVPGLYAIGDLTGAPMLAHKAEPDGIRCVEAIAGRVTGPHSPVPACIYASPQIASVGLTEAQALGAGRNVRVGRFSLRGNGKALVLGEPDGLIKTVFCAQTDRLLGAQLIGAEASELINELTIALTLGATSAQLASVIFPHPTLSEAMYESVLAAREGAIHD